MRIAVPGLNSVGNPDPMMQQMAVAVMIVQPSNAHQCTSKVPGTRCYSSVRHGSRYGQSPDCTLVIVTACRRDRRDWPSGRHVHCPLAVVGLPEPQGHIISAIPA